MKKIIISFFFLISIIAQAQVFEGAKMAIGIDEKLDSIIPLDLKFKAEDGAEMTLGDIIDKPTILSFVYFNCPGLCSPLQEGVSNLIDNSDLVIGEDYQSITISFDYKDDPIQASKKKKNFAQCISKDKCSNWFYLTGDSASINSILAAVGYKIKLMGLDYAHPSGIVVISPKGKITRYLYGTEFLPFDFKMAIIEAEKGLSRPTINKALDFCFSYDPVGQKYTFQVTKIAATVIIFFGVILLLVLTIKSRRKKKNDTV